jgi:hypothetical protein
MTQIFTFPSGSSVELPEGMPMCQGFKVPARDSLCPAYNRAGSVSRQQQEVAERERILTAARSAGRRTGRLAEWLEHHRDILNRMLTQCATNPAPCTCER